MCRMYLKPNTISFVHCLYKVTKVLLSFLHTSTNTYSTQNSEVSPSFCFFLEIPIKTLPPGPFFRCHCSGPGQFDSFFIPTFCHGGIYQSYFTLLFTIFKNINICCYCKKCWLHELAELTV